MLRGRSMRAQSFYTSLWGLQRIFKHGTSEQQLQAAANLSSRLLFGRISAEGFLRQPENLQAAALDRLVAREIRYISLLSIIMDLSNRPGLDIGLANALSRASLPRLLDLARNATGQNLRTLIEDKDAPNGKKLQIYSVKQSFAPEREFFTRMKRFLPEKTYLFDRMLEVLPQDETETLTLTRNY